MRRRTPPHVPEPPQELPPGRTVYLPGRGETFVRDTGGDGPVTLLLHGWMITADLNWITVYAPLREAGYRVVAIDHRGHGRGLRSPEPFRLQACADDLAALLGAEGIERAVVVGYSMGGPIGCLLARDHRELVAGLVLCVAAPDWREPHMRRAWNTMALLRLGLGVFPNASWRAGLRSLGYPDTPATTWAASELSRSSARDVAEAGRELGRFDGRSWLGELSVPAIVIVAADDTQVPPAKQHELAGLLRAPVAEVSGNHSAITRRPRAFARTLLQAMAEVGDRATTLGAR
jgi:pimeloyl-ACP methyl ester carboxylesterase